MEKADALIVYYIPGNFRQNIPKNSIDNLK